MADPAHTPAPDALQLTDEARRTLIRVIRVAFPHPQVPDGPYERMADRIIAESAEPTWSRMALTQGLLTLDAPDGTPFVDLPDDQALGALQALGDLEFFSSIRRATVLSLYDDPEVWDIFGYEGESFSKGGYLHRGFDDLDWLPDPRIEESEETLTEIGPLDYEIVTAAVPVKDAPTDADRDTIESTDHPFDDLFKGSDIVEGATSA